MWRIPANDFTVYYWSTVGGKVHRATNVPVKSREVQVEIMNHYADSNHFVKVSSKICSQLPHSPFIFCPKLSGRITIDRHVSMHNGALSYWLGAPLLKADDLFSDNG